MKRRRWMLAALLWGVITACAQVTDAFHGILPVTDRAMMKTLNGEWSLKVVEGIEEEDTNVPPEDATWGKIPVPGCWEAYGFCQPRYDSAARLTGYYRTVFSIPDMWKGMRIALRLDGVLYGYDLWIDGQPVGSWRSGYNTAIFDITDQLARQKDGKSLHQLALRVVTQFAGSDFDYNDDWAPAGIIRDVTLMAVPETHLSDLTIRTENSGRVNVATTMAKPRKGLLLTHEIVDSQGRTVCTTCTTADGSAQTTMLTVNGPRLWTAETPNLYTLRSTLTRRGKMLQTFEHRFGFRELTIEGNVLKLNGQPVKLRGVTSHSTDPVSVKVVSEELTLKDMRLMKEASINYIRTSHYPREPRFYELADSLGFYIIDEVPFGFGDKNLNKEEFYPVLQQRAQATIRRDKNHPSVLLWSLGNENPLTDICIRLGGYVKDQLDASRPYCYPQVGSYFRRFFEGDQAKGFPAPAPIYAPHYPTTGQIGGFYQHTDRPVIFTEYCHTLGTSFEDHDRQWEIIERTPGIAGGSVWEWVDQGMPFSTGADPFGPYGYEEKVFTSESGGFEMHGNKGTDGLLYADRTPLPNYYELQHNYARALIAGVEYDNSREGGASPTARLHLKNRYDFLDLKDNVTFGWTLMADRDTVARGAFSPACAPHDSTTYTLALPHSALTPTRTQVLHFTLTDAQGHTFLRQSFPLHKPRHAWKGDGKAAERLQWALLVRAGRKPTLAEMVTQKGRLPEHYLLPLDNEMVRADVKHAPIEGGEEITFTLTPDTADVFRAELGITFLLDSSIDRVQWMGQGPFASYPGRSQANRYGIWGKRCGDLYLEGNHRGVEAALLTDSLGNGVLLTGDALDLNFEQTDRGLIVTVNAAVAGQGPKFRKTAFPPVIDASGTVSARFCLYRIDAGHPMYGPDGLFAPPAEVPAAFRPFLKQYDTYLMRFDDILLRHK